MIDIKLLAYCLQFYYCLGKALFPLSELPADEISKMDVNSILHTK